jgi:chemotaxis signal transduction protein
MPVYLLGISNWRGEAIWVLDLAGLLGGEGLTHREALPHSCMAIVMPAGEQHLGILVDQVKTIDEYDPQSLQPISAEMGDAEFVSMCKGYFAHEAADPLWLIDVDALLQKVLI